MVTRTARGDVALGFVIAVGSMLVGGLGIVVMPILYFVLRPGTPHFARGIGYGFLTTLTLLLGAFALCVYGLGHESR